MSELSCVAAGKAIIDMTSANPLRHLFDHRSNKERIRRILGHIIVVGARLLVGRCRFWRLHTFLLKGLTVPWSSYTKSEFLRFIRGADLALMQFFTYGKPVTPTTHMAVQTGDFMH